MVENIADLMATFSFILLNFNQISKLWSLDLNLRFAESDIDSDRYYREKRIKSALLPTVTIIDLVLGATIIALKSIDHYYMSILLGSNFLILSISTAVVNLNVIRKCFPGDLSFGPE